MYSCGHVPWLRFFRAFSSVVKANARVKLAKTGHGPHSSTLICICVVRLLFVLLYVLFVCKCVLPPGDNPIAVNKYIVYGNSDAIKCGLPAVARTVPLSAWHLFTTLRKFVLEPIAKPSHTETRLLRKVLEAIEQYLFLNYPLGD